MIRQGGRVGEAGGGAQRACAERRRRLDDRGDPTAGRRLAGGQSQDKEQRQAHAGSLAANNEGGVSLTGERRYGPAALRTDGTRVA